jgi:hypothetical protein
MGLSRDEVRVLQWMPFNINPSIELLFAYARGVEDQADRGIEVYVTKRVTRPPDTSGLESPEGVTTYLKFDSEAFDMDDVFVRYFPSLQRSSAFLSLYSFFESELLFLCELVEKVANPSGPFTRPQRDVITTCRKYLQGAGIETKGGGVEWNEVTNLRDVRNCIAHADAKMAPKSKELWDYVKKNEFLDVHTTSIIHVKKGFLDHALKAFDRYFYVLWRGIENSRFKPTPPVP